MNNFIVIKYIISSCLLSKFLLIEDLDIHISFMNNMINISEKAATLSWLISTYKLKLIYSKFQSDLNTTMTV